MQLIPKCDEPLHLLFHLDCVALIVHFLMAYMGPNRKKFTTHRLSFTGEVPSVIRLLILGGTVDPRFMYSIGQKKAVLKFKVLKSR
jgi:hypothetical protein